MASKGHGLSFPSNPLAALRALQDLDAAAAPPPSPIPEEGEPGPPTSPATGSEGDSATRGAAAKKPGARRVRGGAEAEAKRPGDAADPLGDAVRELLARPYAGEDARAPVTVSTVKDTLANVERFVDGNLRGGVDHLFVVPSPSVHRIQEAQTTLYHALWELTSDSLEGDRVPRHPR